ncbi:hypothetical protein ACFLYN_04255 [Chloroflexota bacterium]
MSQKSSSLYKRVARFIITAIGLGIIGIAFGIGGAYIGGRVVGAGSVGFGALGLAIIGLFVGYPAGIVIGIILIKRLLHWHGSLLLGIIGIIVGMVTVITLAALLSLNSGIDLLVIILLLIVPVFCLIGFNLKKQTTSGK